MSPCRINLVYAEVALDVDAVEESTKRILEQTWAAKCDDPPPGSASEPASRARPVPSVRFRYRFLDADPDAAPESFVDVRSLRFKWMPGADHDRFIDVERRAEVAVRPGGQDQIRFSAGGMTGVPQLALVSCLDLVLVHAALLQGWAACHAAGFALADRNVIVFGPSGAGKSTLCMGVLNSGGRVVSDDTLLVSVNLAGFPEMVPFRPELRLREGSLSLVPKHLFGKLLMQQASEAPDGCGRRYVLGRAGSDNVFLDRATPTVLWILDGQAGSSEETTHGPLAQADSMAAAISGSLPLFTSRRFPEERTQLTEVLYALATRTRGLRVSLGRDFVADPVRVLDRLLSAT